MDVMLRRRQLMAMQTGGLPSEYRRVEYLQGTGTQYINTQVTIGVMSSFNTNWAMKFAITEGGTKIIAGQNDEYKQIPILNGKIRLDWALRNTTQYFAQGIEYYTVYELKQNGNNLVFGGESVAISQEANRESKFALFAKLFSNGSVEAGTISKMRLYSFTAENSGLPVLNLIPCIRKSDSKPGMYDTVSKTFYTNAGSGEFIVPA